MVAAIAEHLTRSRQVFGLADGIGTFEGAGVEVHRPFPTAALPLLDPFLLLDHLGPKLWAPMQAVGFPDHPHRGFETVTYLLAGELQHRDSVGNSGLLGPGDVQWMTAGRGVVHSEMPSPALKRDGGWSHGFQLWVNLPATHKMMAPRYQEVPGGRIPTGTSDDGLVTAKVIAGRALGARATIETVTPITLLHLTLQPGGRIIQPIPEDHNVGAYVFAGEAQIGPQGIPVGRDRLAIFEEGDVVEITNAPGNDAPADVLLLSGLPLDEPVARYGPFVMSTTQEIEQAFDDYRAGRLGRITA